MCGTSLASPTFFKDTVRPPTIDGYIDAPAHIIKDFAIHPHLLDDGKFSEVAFDVSEIHSGRLAADVTFASMYEAQDFIYKKIYPAGKDEYGNKYIALRYRCVCAICDWKGIRTKAKMFRPCPKCFHTLVTQIDPDDESVEKRYVRRELRKMGMSEKQIADLGFGSTGNNDETT